MSELHCTTTTGTDRTLPAGAVEKFVSGLKGSALRPGAEGYEHARKVWNGMIDRRPGLIVRCAAVSDVVCAVNLARENDLLVAVRGGGHNVAGNAVCDGGLMIDMSTMKQIDVDPIKRIARADGGLTWADFDAATQKHGLATTGGVISATGIAGLTLGGGIGWLSRMHGLSIDNMLSVDVVTADGARVKASESENPDLFWGLRGGGGNFGIATSFEYRLHPVGPEVFGGPVFFPASQARDVLRFYREWAPSLPEWANTLSGFLTAADPMFPAELQGTLMLVIVFGAFGPLEQAESLARPLRTIGTPTADLMGTLPYTTLQSIFDAGFPAGVPCYWKSDYLSDLSDGAIDTLIHYFSIKPSPLCTLACHQLGGASARVGEDETAVSYRKALYAPSILALWTDPRDEETNIQWARDCWTAMQPYATGVYVNFLGDEGDARVRAAYGEAKYARLVALKNTYDPDNLFRLNQNIKPSATRQHI